MYFLLVLEHILSRASTYFVVLFHYYTHTEPTEKSILKAWDFCAEKARSVEIVYKDDDLDEEVLTRVHFNVNVNVSSRNTATTKTVQWA